MGVKSKFKYYLEQYLNKKNYSIIRNSQIYEWQKVYSTKPSFNISDLPNDAVEYLVPENPRLIELQKKYSSVKEQNHILWTQNHVKSEDILYFRGDNAYVWQLRGTNMNILGYALTTYYVKSIDKMNLLDSLHEDKYFGNFTFQIDGKTISRDLLDSINEIYFIEKHLKLFSKSDFNILDIGAGYGRLAHRVVKSYEHLGHYYCTDGIAVSTFIQEYYLRFRKIDNKASIVLQSEVEDLLDKKKINLAINIHSFSECSIEDVEWWINVLKNNNVKYLMIVPNIYLNSKEIMVSHDRKSILKVLEKNGYELVIKEPKFKDPVVQQYGINPTYYFLFELK